MIDNPNIANREHSIRNHYIRNSVEKILNCKLQIPHP